MKRFSSARPISSNCSGGFSVAETLVAGVILLVVLAVLFQLLLPSFSLFRAQMAFSQAHQNVLLSSQKLKRELANTGTSTLAVMDTALSFAAKDPDSPFDDRGRPRFARQFIVYYLNSEEKLIRKVWPYGSDTPPEDLFDGPEPPRLSQELLLQATTKLNGSERVMAPHVSHFLVTDSGSDSVLLEPPLVLELKCKVATSSEKFEEYEVQLEIFPRTIQW